MDTGSNTKNIDELLIKISGRLPITKKLAIGNDVMVQISGAIVKEETSDNQDGTVNICYVIKGLTAKIQ